MVNDTISDFLTRIRNANNSKHHLVEVVSTNVTKNIVQILKEEGFINDFQILESEAQNTIIISLKYSSQTRQPVLKNLQRVSKPGIRVYARKKNISNVLGTLGTVILSTSQGIMTDRKAKLLNIGGEILCRIS